MNNGFFEEEALSLKQQKIIKPRIKKPIKQNCEKCGLSINCKNPKLGIQGNGKSGILLIYNQIELEDDLKGKYLTGRIGKNIKRLFPEDYDIYDECWIVPAIQCYSKKEVKPAKATICAAKIREYIKQLNPKLILTFGKFAIDSVVLHKLTGRVNKATLVDWVNYQIPDQEYKCYVCPTWGDYQYYVKRNNTWQDDIVIKKQMVSDISKALEMVNKPFYISNYNGDAFSITDKDEAIKIINEYKDKKIFALDYETTGIKPHREAHQIYTASISDGLFAYSFPFFQDKDFKDAWKELLTNDAIKIAHNAKFENTWTYNKAHNKKYWINRLTKDTMLNAHSIDNRKKVGLKFLTYIHLGILGYDSSIDPYLESTKEEQDEYGANAYNRIKEAPLNDVLHYNALDSLFTFKIYQLQKTLLDNHTKIGSEFFTDSSIELGKAENHGVYLDQMDAVHEYNKLTKRMEKLELKIKYSDEMEKWDLPNEFRPSAPGDLTHLVFKCLQLKSNGILTATGKEKADVEALEKIDSEVAKYTLQWRKLKKVRDTYLKGFMKEAVNSIIHTSLNLHTVTTFRSSSNDPNLQNVPARDQEVTSLLRKLIIARPNHKLGEYDYKAMEAAIVAIYNKDPNWINYVSDINNDMHRDMAAKLVIRNKEDVLKSERQTVKSSFVFATVYGSYWKNTAKGLWDSFEPETIKHLKSKGIINLEDYRSHVKKVETWFWQDQFPVGYEWMNKTIKDYEKKGYVELLTGFRCYGPMSRNQILNTPVQGTASHCKLWTLNRISKLITKKNMNSRIVLEIHDSIIPDIDPAEEDYLDYQIWLYGTQKIREYFDWLIVPLFIEKKISEVNGNWSEMENKGLLKGEYLNG